MKDAQRNYAAEAVETLGGPTKMSNAVGVSNVTVHYWVKVGKISNAVYAVQVEQLTRAAGKPIAKDPMTAVYLLGGGDPGSLGPKVTPITRGSGKKGRNRSAPAQNRTGT